MHRFCQVLLLFFYCYLVDSAQPYFPSQVVFTLNSGQTLYAIDEVNQRAFTTSGDISSYVFQHFPYAPSDTPQSKYYVQLVTGFYNDTCAYGTYWQYGGNPYNYFPIHWDNQTSFQIANYLDLNYKMIHSTNSSDLEDYWYSNEICHADNGETNPCFQIYFQKNTEIPLRSTTIIVRGFRQVFRTTEYQIISIGKPDDKYFNSIPKDWYTKCEDVMLKVAYSYDSPMIALNETIIVGVSLFTPPHRINGNETVTIQWKSCDGCCECLTWTPKELSFNSQNFYEEQNLTVTRVEKSSRDINIIPNFIGGGFPPETPSLNTINFV